MTRLEALETRIAHQDAIIEDLNQTVAKQWREIDRLARELAKLADRVAVTELQNPGDPGQEPPPPHY
jgi:SlyX protein